jgi:hypothetical protein
MHPLHQLQDRMHLHASGKEEESAQGVISISAFINITTANSCYQCQIYRRIGKPYEETGRLVENGGTRGQ